MIPRGSVQYIFHGEILRERDVATLEIRLHVVRSAIPDLQRISFANNLKIAERMRGIQLQLDPKMRGCLRAIRVRAQRNG